MNENMHHSEDNYPVRIPDDSPVGGTIGGEFDDPIILPDGRRVTPSGDVIRDPSSSVPEIMPPHEYTPEKEDLDLLIM